MGRPRKTLADHVLEGTFRGRREPHRSLLAGPDLSWPGFALLQADYRAARSDPERRAAALAFERAVQVAQATSLRASGDMPGALQAELAALGKPGSAAALINFFSTYLVHPKGPLRGQPFKLERWQQQFLRELYRRDKQGRRVYRHAVLGLPRGSGKTALAAGIALYELLTRTDAPEVIFAAGSKEQAGIGLSFARSFVEESPLADWINLKKALTCPASAGTLRVVSAAGSLQHGLAPAVALVDELWAFATAAQRETYIALSSALHKRQDSYLLAITTAGFDQYSLLGEIYEAALDYPDITVSDDGCLLICRDEENGSLFWWYGAPQGCPLDDETIWRNSNPASFVDLRDLKRQLNDPGLGENEFRRLSLNQWTTARDAWLPGTTWADLESNEVIPARGEIYIGVDIGISHDTSAVCWAHPLPDGRILLRVRVWSARADVPTHELVPGGNVLIEPIENFILELAKKFRVREVAYDPAFFQRSAETLEKKHRLNMIEYRQSSAPMYAAYQSFYQHAREERLTHNGDKVFAAHIDATTAVKTDRGWRLSKTHSSRPIDATVAAALAVARAQHHKKPAKPNVYWMDLEQ